MKLVHRLFRFYINSSIHVALAVCCLAVITDWEFTLNIRWPFFTFLFFGSITGYNFVKYAKMAGLHHRSLTDSLRTIQIFSFICFGFLIWTALMQPIQTLVVAGGFGLLTLLYAMPLFKGRNLRNIAGIKAFVVAMVWAGATVWVPVFHAEEPITRDVLITFLQRFLLILVLILPFEIRDIPYDKPFLRTLPQIWGVENMKRAGIILLGVIFFMELGKTSVETAQWIGLLSVIILSVLALWFSKRKQPVYYASFWVEGIPIFWFLILTLARYVFL